MEDFLAVESDAKIFNLKFKHDYFYLSLLKQNHGA